MSAQYRRLSLDELKELEKEFIDFLVINGITADDWVRIRDQESAKADRIIDLFSDVVFEGILRKAKFLEFVGKSSIMTFQCLKDKLILIGMDSTDPSLDLTDEETYRKLSEGQYLDSVKVYKQEKKYSMDRNSEIFKMIEQGCYITEGYWFKKLALLLAK
jgi:hypothetical protein